MKRVYDFAEGSASMRSVLGGKGANLAEMTSLGLPVPPGFTITTATCMDYLTHSANGTLPPALVEDIQAACARLEKRSHRRFGDPDHLLLVSVRSGAMYSMPGMMDTILNLGLNDELLPDFAAQTNLTFAYDCYRRLLQMFGSVVYQIDELHFSQALADAEQKAGHSLTSFSQTEWDDIITTFKTIYVEHGRQFPQQPLEQLQAAVIAVFQSWNNKRARVYRQLHNISNDLGTAVNIQQMVFGNRGEQSGTGVVFTRNPVTGKDQLYGEYLLNAQGEDIVAGIRTPLPISDLTATMPSIYAQLQQCAYTLEHHYRDMQDIEFTIEDQTLYLLQTRNGKRTGQAAITIAVQMAQEGFITKEEALLNVSTDSLNQVLHPTFDQHALSVASLLATGLPASPGAASGQIVFTAEEAKKQVAQGNKVILVRQETSPEDIEGMIVSEAILTSRGGLTSHAAVVARGLGKCCVVGCDALFISENDRLLKIGDQTITDVISVNGSDGAIYKGHIPTTSATIHKEFKTLMEWADEYAQLNVRANAETLHDLQTALSFGASGVGLARTEHMFFGVERLKEMRRYILAETPQEQEEAINALLAFQKADFKAMYAITKNKKMIVRLLDPPMHEFLPEKETDIATVAADLNKSVAQLKQIIRQVKELNPMLGHRGCRLGVTTPTLYQMQVEAMITSAIELQAEGIFVAPAIMIPLISTENELLFIKERLEERIQDIFTKTGMSVPYTIGTMIELPRACMITDQLAKHVDFFSFGTNDLTQTTFGLSRDDCGSFMHDYLERNIFPFDPFQHIDVTGVGALITIAVQRARSVKPNISIGICGEVGGDPTSIKFFHELGIEYVSCSPYRIPLARLSVAQEAIKTNTASQKIAITS